MSDGVLAVRDGQVLILECKPMAGVAVFHPPGDYSYMDGDKLVVTPYGEIAKQKLDAAKFGCRWTFPLAFDERGNKLWDIKRIDVGIDVESHLEAQKHVDASLSKTGITAVVLPACVRVVGVAG